MKDKSIRQYFSLSASGGDKLKASNSKIYIQDKLYLDTRNQMTLSIKVNHIYYKKILKKNTINTTRFKNFTDIGDSLFGKGGEGIRYRFSSWNIDAKIKRKKIKLMKVNYQHNK